MWCNRECGAKEREKGHPWDAESNSVLRPRVPKPGSNKTTTKNKPSEASENQESSALFQCHSKLLCLWKREKEEFSESRTNARKWRKRNIKRTRKPFSEGYITQSLRIVHTNSLLGEEDRTDAHSRSCLLVLGSMWMTNKNLGHQSR